MQNEQKPHKQILFALGGTGGHLFPALGLARSLKQAGETALVFAGSGLASNPFFEKGELTYRELRSATPFSKKPLAACRSLFTLFRGIREALSLINETSPQMVIGFGSFHAFPLMMAARIKKVPYLLFEPNAFLGKVNRLFAKGAQMVALQFEQAKGALPIPHSLIEFPIMPRPPSPDAEEARKGYGLDRGAPTLLILGGSQGAEFLNKIAPEISIEPPFQVIHLAGRNAHFRSIEQKWKSQGIQATVLAFEPRMERAFAAADCALCRSGANTLSELIAYGIPALLIPYPFAYDHQMKNARVFEQIGGGLVLNQKEASGQLLNEKITQLLSCDLKKHKQNLLAFKVRGERRPLANIVLEQLRKL